MDCPANDSPANEVPMLIPPLMPPLPAAIEAEKEPVIPTWRNTGGGVNTGRGGVNTGRSQSSQPAEIPWGGVNTGGGASRLGLHKISG